MMVVMMRGDGDVCYDAEKTNAELTEQVVAMDAGGSSAILETPQRHYPLFVGCGQRFWHAQGTTRNLSATSGELGKVYTAGDRVEGDVEAVRDMAANAAVQFKADARKGFFADAR
ncbi:hypothetical protein POM88_027931 [Heracleum sosnowskyi]|uniref:Uncharacterized protein n=1 Tax=Heracleum sosnowskyi TaxID=360622 RepID=A0AAD8I8I4_9APIA|nr:hypothetical protein POM88_027931 [Heracleum sosnowskyi]